MNCPVCDAIIVSNPKNKPKRFCSIKCGTKFHQKPLKEPIKHICEYKPCSKEFYGRPDKRFCSDNCRTAYSHGCTYVPGIREYNYKSSPVHIKQCPITNALFLARPKNKMYHPSLTDEDIYKWKLAKAIKVKPIHICKECCIEFKAHKSKHGICVKCASRAARNKAKAIRRSRKNHTGHEIVIPFKVFNRCNWICTYCGKHTPKNMRGKHEHNSPELDHIVPLSKGGQHTYLNTTLACRSCNNIKSDKELEALSSTNNKS